MRLFDFVEQHDGIRIAPHFFGELAAFLVADVAGRRTDEPRDVELLHVFAHVEMDERFGVAEHLFGERLGQQRLAHAGRAEQQKCADGPARVFQIRARAAQRLANGGDGFALADDDFFHLVFHRRAAAAFRPAPSACSGMPVHLETTCKMSSSSTTTRFSSRARAPVAAAGFPVFPWPAFPCRASGPRLRNPGS